MSDHPETEPVDTVNEGYNEAQPASARDVDRAREQEELLESSPRHDSDRSLTGQTHARPAEEPDELAERHRADDERDER